MARILTQTEVRRLLPMDACIELMTRALMTLGRGEAINPLRSLIRLHGGRGILGMMPGHLGSPESLGLKVVTVFPHNEGTPYDSHQGVVLLLDPARGIPLAVMDASEITAIRTAAVSGVATRLLAREESLDLAILGSGVQARTHLEAMKLARKLRRVRVFSPDKENRERFAEKESSRHGISVEPASSAREAVDGADLVCTVTSSHEPVVEGEWLAPGVHINAVGSSVPTARELDSAAVARSRLFVDRRESTLNEAGDFLIPKKEGVIGDDHIVAEIGEVLLDQKQGRRFAEEITLFKSLGLAVEDLAAAHHVHREAEKQDVGTTVELGGLRDAAD